MGDEEARKTVAIQNQMNRIRNLDLPSTEKTTRVLDDIVTSQTLEAVKDDISPQGKKVMDDIMLIIQDLKMILEDKNANDEIQQVIVNSYQAQRLLESESESECKPRVQFYKNNIFRMTKCLAEISRMLIISPEFRQTMKNLVQWLLDVVNSTTGTRIP